MWRRKRDDCNNKGSVNRDEDETMRVAQPPQPPQQQQQERQALSSAEAFDERRHTAIDRHAISVSRRELRQAHAMQPVSSSAILVANSISVSVQI